MLILVPGHKEVSEVNRKFLVKQSTKNHFVINQIESFGSIKKTCKNRRAFMHVAGDRIFAVPVQREVDIFGLKPNWRPEVEKESG